jgi:ATP-binding cassette, subfamily C, bacterial LapB
VAIKPVQPISATCSHTGATIAEPKVPGAIYLASLVINLLALGLPLVSLQVYDRVIPNHSRETLAFLIIGLVLTLALDLFLRTVRSALLSWRALCFVRQLEHELVTRILHAPSGTAEHDPIAVQVNRFAATASLGNYHAGASRLAAIDIPFVLVTLAIFAIVGGFMVLVPIALFLLFAVVALRRTQQCHEIARERSTQDNKKYDFISEVLTGILTVKSAAMEPQMLRRYERLQQPVADTTMRSILVSHSAQSSAALYGNLSQIIVVSIGAIRVIDDQMSIGALACCTMLAGQVLMPLLRAISLWTEREAAAHWRAQIQQLLALPASKATNGPAQDIRGEIRFDDVCLEQGQSPNFLRNASFSVQPGAVIGLAGKDGSARTAVLNLVLGDTVPTSGHVLIDGVSTTDVSFADVRKAIAYVGPSPAIFRGTILENLTCFQPHRNRFAREMAALAGLERAVNELPNGYDTLLGTSIDEIIPASVAQQITIVRALSMQPRVLLFDEATAILDRRAEAALITTIAKLRGASTLLVATHRPSLLATADVVYKVTDAKLLQLATAPSLATAAA